MLTQADDVEDERSREARENSDSADIFATVRVPRPVHWQLLWCFTRRCAGERLGRH